ncbi:MAG: glycosyltransferase family 4 protein [Bacillota bacterium]|nr:glycosyltransferase family 4 protein [Bacillota bacterium]
MRILMLSWEYPPYSVGGLASHVEDLLEAYQDQNIECHLITLADSNSTTPIEVKHNIHIHRIKPYDSVSALDFITWVLQTNIAMLEYANGLIYRTGSFDLVHAHDWLVAFTARALKHSLKIPVIATIHATERGRNNGIHTPMQRYIDNVEWWLCYEAWQVICCSKHMHGEITRNFQVPSDKVTIIPNGVDPGKLEGKGNSPSLEQQYIATDKVVSFIGRLVREKGIQVLIDAAPKILEHYPNTRFVIAGKGPYQQELQNQVNKMGLAQQINFLGYVDDDAKKFLLNRSDIACFPSLYEPFGIVALEGMISKTPVVVSQVGGFDEIIDHGITGMKAYPGNANSLADQILAIFDKKVNVNQMIANAYQKVWDEYTWDKIAANTIEVYQEVKIEAANANWISVYDKELNNTLNTNRLEH